MAYTEWNGQQFLKRHRLFFRGLTALPWYSLSWWFSIKCKSLLSTCHYLFMIGDAQISPSHINFCGDVSYWLHHTFVILLEFERKCEKEELLLLSVWWWQQIWTWIIQLVQSINLTKAFHVATCCFLLADETWIQNVYINLPAVNRRAETIASRRAVKKEWQVRWS